MSENEHGCADIGRDDEDWWYVKCDCGFESAGFPDPATAVDELIDHCRDRFSFKPPQKPAEPVSPETVAAIERCPTRVYHETHRYCPSCPWTEEIEAQYREQLRAAGGSGR
jgi:ribosomal protein L37E